MASYPNLRGQGGLPCGGNIYTETNRVSVSYPGQNRKNVSGRESGQCKRLQDSEEPQKEPTWLQGGRKGRLVLAENWLLSDPLLTRLRM